MKYTMLEIQFKDGGTMTYDKDSGWNDWDVEAGFVVVKDKEGLWIGMFNCDSVKYVIVSGEDE